MNIRREVQNALQKQDFEKVVACFVENDAMTSRYLQMHVYGLPSDIIRWTAIEYIGKLAGLYASDHDVLFRNIIRRFIWQMCEESANVPWASAEVVGSIIANVPGKRFEEFIGPLFYHTDLNDICYSGLYWILPDLTKEHAEKVADYLPNTFYWFEQFDMADLRAYAAVYFRQYPYDEMQKYLQEWSNDRRCVSLYLNNAVDEYCVADLAQDAIF
ncbi:MAG: hypothetical protein UDG94_12195 [Peptococcaceae bacterium]|nr:hypothetical protein [Peptococcaceae bacterium]